ncbi:MAG: FG-GAP-like repeat-containing protein [Gemmatimonadota bacterium]
MAQLTVTVQGRILDASTGQPLANANIRVPGTPISAVSAGTGGYSVQVSAGSLVLRVTRAGYVEQSRAITAPQGATLTQDFTLVPVGPQNQALRAVLVEPSPGDMVRTDSLGVPAGAQRHRQMLFVDQGFASEPPRRLRLPLFDDVDLELHADRITVSPDGVVRWVGRIADPRGFEKGTAVIVVRDGRLTANIRFDGRLFEVRPYDQRIHVVLEIAPPGTGRGNLPLDTSPPPLPPPPPEPPEWFLPEIPFIDIIPDWIRPFEQVWVAGRISPNVCSDLVNMKAGPFPEIRVMVLYTDSVEKALGDILSDIDIMIEYTNIALQHSEIPQRLVLARAERIETTDPTADVTSTAASVHLERLENSTDGTFDEIHDWRNESWSDIVVLIVKNSGGGQARTLESVTLDHAKHAFAVAVHDEPSVSMNTGFTGEGRDHVFSFVHEVGHLMAAQHDRGLNPPPQILNKPYHYNHGYAPTSNPVTTAMSIQQPGKERLLWFSNPELSYNGYPLGLPSTDPDAADNRHALANAAAVVSAFRLTPVWFASAGATSPWYEKKLGKDAIKAVRFADFDGDGETDAFRLDVDGQKWLWSRSASEPWTTLNNNPVPFVPLKDLAFGDFDGDGQTDVFRSSVTEGKWFWSKSGTSSWVELNAGANLKVPVDELGFGDFDGGGTDVFVSDPGTAKWFISKGGSGPLVAGPGSSLALPVSHLRFADFDGDHKDDVFSVDPIAGKWSYSSAASGTWEDLSTGKGDALATLAFGDFDGDGSADVFKADGQNWWVSNGGTQPWHIVRRSCYTLASLAFGDFDGDGTTDVIRAGIRP